MTTAARIRRGPPPKPRSLKRVAGKALIKRPSLVRRLVARLPVRQETWERLTRWGVVGACVLLAGTAATFLGVPQMAATEVAEAIGRAGFQVKRVEVTGIDRMERLTVYAIALDQQSMAMPLVDLDKVRGQLLRYGWVEDARVSRRLPDTLVVDIVERKPAAIWQNQGALTLIDRGGVVLEPVALEAMPNLPLVIGPDANRQQAGLSRLLDRAPALRPVLEGATWVGGRRWDLRFQSGETLALPEGEADAAQALRRFVAIDGAERLLGRGFVRFDMRDPEKFVVRLGKGATKARAEAASGDAST